MKRLINEELLNWKNKADRKPLVVYGARQVGKTYSIMDFGLKNYAAVAYFFFDNNPGLCSIFKQGISSIPSLMLKLEAHINQSVSAQNTLIFFDEVQACPKALQALKLFRETAPEYHIIAAGSLLGVAYNREGVSFPVGMVDELRMYPLTFEEFLLEFNPGILTIIKDCYDSNSPLDSLLHEQALELFLKYLVIGGMPEVITEFQKTNDYVMVRAKQLAICSNYAADMSKYTDTKSQALKNEAVFDSLPSQLAKTNKKFQYAVIKSGARASAYEFSLDWLTKASVVIRCNKVKEGKEPLASYEDFSSYKVYMSDVGLFCAKSGNSHLSVTGRTMGDSAKGALTESYVAQHLHANGFRIFYWESGNQAEVDFVIQIENDVVPIEVKSCNAVRSQSLEVFRKRYNTNRAIRISARNFGYENGIKSIPLYAVWCLR